MTYLLIKRGGQREGNRLYLHEFPATLGRDPANTVMIADAKISRFHLRIKKRGRLFIIEDLDSHNGSYINGDRVVNSLVQAGDHILIGDTELMFVTPSATVDFASDALKLEGLADLYQGLDGTGAQPPPPEDDSLPLITLPTSSFHNKRASNGRHLKQVYEIHSNIMTMGSLEEGSKALIKGLAQLAPVISRCVVFAWSSLQHQLIPTASKQQREQESPAQAFQFSQRLLSEALARKQGFGLSSPQRLRLVLPMLHNRELICLVHLEVDQLAQLLPERQLEALQYLLDRCAPVFASMLLRLEVDALMRGSLETLVATIEAKDTYTVGHSERVCRFSMAIAEELRLNKEIKHLLMISSLCHDIGKIGIPDAILKKAGLLSPEEYQEMKLHPTIGANIIAHLPNAQRFISGVKYHHEKWDGTGYPEGLSGENIPFFGRIIAVADVFDAMISGRSYSGFIDESEAIEKIHSEAELFDPEILKALARAWDSGTLTQRTSTLNQLQTDPGNKKSK